MEFNKLRQSLNRGTPAKMNWFHRISLLFKEFKCETGTKPLYEVINVYSCKKTGFTKAVIKLAEHYTIEKSISDIVFDTQFIEGLDKKTIRTFTYIATIEQRKPDYSIVVQQLTDQIDEYLLEIESKQHRTTFKKSASELSKDKISLAKFDPIEANRIGYMAGVRETVKEYKLIQNLKD
jgi:hypothetical protein